MGTKLLLVGHIDGKSEAMCTSGEMYGTMLIEALPVISGGTVKRQEV